MIIVIINGCINPFRSKYIELGRKKLKKYSKQRELILTNLQNRCDHPTADMLYRDLKEEMPQIGIATIYRNVLELCEENKIRRITVGNGPDRFDGNLVHHVHFICSNCQKLQDIFLNEMEEEELEDQMKLLVNSIGGEKENVQIMITGTCKECKQASI